MILILFDDVQLKASRAGVPLTSMAAHVVDEEVEIEFDDKDTREKNEFPGPVEIENGVVYKARSLPLLPPTLTSSGTNYSQVSSSPSRVQPVELLYQIRFHVCQILCYNCFAFIISCNGFI